MTYLYRLEYNLIEGCKDNFVYVEYITGEMEAKDSDIECAKRIMDKVDRFLIEEFKKRGYLIFDFWNKKEVAFDELLNPFFLFHYVSGASWDMVYIITKDKDYLEKYGDIYYRDWLEDKKDGFVVQNDSDGYCVYVYCSDDSNENMWFFDHMRKFNDKIKPLELSDDTLERRTLFEVIKDMIFPKKES